MFKFIFDIDTWQEIFEGIRKNKLRTAITIFGVMWGIFLLVVLLGMARGFENYFEKQFGGFATNSVFVWGRSTGKPFKGYQTGRTIRLTSSDVIAVRNNIEGLEFVVPRNRANALVVNGLEAVNQMIYGDYPLLHQIQKKDLVYGRFINENDIKERKKVCVIEKDIYKKLFEIDEYPIGQYIKINNINYQVVGMYKRGTIYMGDAIHIPFSTFQQVYSQGDKIGVMIVTGKPEFDIVQIESDAKLLLKNLHQVNPEDTRAFGSMNLGKEVEKFTGFLTGIQFLTWFVGIATLIAGIFAIGNILLITVKERTQEIGIRRALGAKPKEIKQQIVLESVFLTSIAGALGIIFGGAILFWVDNMAAVKSGDVPLENPTVNIPIIILAVFLLVILGTLIGLIPAHIATSIKPIDALRDE